MKKFTSFWFLQILIIVHSSALFAQESNNSNLSNEEIENYTDQISKLVNYLEGTLNFLGDPESVPKEKEIIINESYKKIFIDDKVQIEDDLDENREVLLNKDVQAYLKDIEFFFKSVKFKFIVADISHYVNDSSRHFFRVTFNRKLDGITITGDSVSSGRQRFMEVNLDLANNDLRIASIYTTKINEKEEIRNWWQGLNIHWRKILGGDIVINDTINLADIVFFNDSLFVVTKMLSDSVKDNANYLNSSDTLAFNIELPDERQTYINSRTLYDTIYQDTKYIYSKLKGITNTQIIDISNNDEVRSLKPLNELTDLREVNCSNTLISDLFPLRNLNYLEVLDCSQTPVEDLSPLHYSTTITDLNCSYTLIKDLSSISSLVNIKNLKCNGIRITDLESIHGLSCLKSLECADTQISDIEPLSVLDSLKNLNISGTKVRDLEPISLAQNLKYLNCESTWIVSIEPLKELPKLEVLRMNNTSIGSLQALTGIEKLKKIYCDDTNIEREESINFMKDHPGSLVIFESDALLNGWSELDEEWKRIARGYVEISDPPTKEELHNLLKIEELDISNNVRITNLEPIRILYNIKSLNLASVKSIDFSPIEGAIDLEFLDIRNTKVDSLDFLRNLHKLKEVNIENTQVSSLEPMKDLENLELVYADKTNIDNENAFDFKNQNPDCLVIYKTIELENWWEGLSVAWKDIFSGKITISKDPGREQLHDLLFLDSLEITNNTRISNLYPLTKLQRLRTLYLNGTSVKSLQPLNQLNELKIIHCAQSPVSDLEPLTSLEKLEELNIENTSVNDLSPLELLPGLKVLKCSGTQIKSLKPLSGLSELEHIEINNTIIKSLKPLINLPELKHLKCFNTRISAKNIEKFKSSKPNCEVVFY